MTDDARTSYACLRPTDGGQRQEAQSAAAHRNVNMSSDEQLTVTGSPRIATSVTNRESLKTLPAVPSVPPIAV